MSVYFKHNDHISGSAREIKKIALHPVFMVFIILLITASPGKTDTSLSDEEKKTIVYTMYQNYKKNDFPDVQDIHPQQAMELWKTGKVVFVDTRSQSEMDISMLPDAISQAAFLANPEKYNGKPVIAYCTISYRSGIFTKKMQKGKIQIVNLAGGILAWVLEGGKIYHNTQETKRIHVYGEQWDYPANGYESVKFGFFERLFGT